MILLGKEKLSKRKTHLRNTPPLPKPQSNQKSPVSTRLVYQQPAPHLPARPDRHYITVRQIPQVKRESYENHTNY